MSETARAYDRNDRIAEIDLLRFVAALLVVFFHYTFRGFTADGLSDVAFPELAPISKYGFLGVELFFMISGFVIVMTAASGSLRKFVVSRIVRLYPAYWFGCSVTFIAILTLGRDRFKAAFGQYLINLTMLNEFIYIPSIDGVYWSLAVELTFYFLVVCLLLIRQIHLVQRYLLLWLAAILLIELLPIASLRPLMIVRYSPFFILGILTYLAYASGWTVLRRVAFGIGWALAIHSALESAQRYSAHYRTDFDPIAIAAIISSYATIMIMISLRRTGLLGRRNWSTVGALTYPLYLIHQNIGYMVFNGIGDRINRHVLLALVIALMLGLAHLMHTRVERPLSTYLKPWLNKRLWGRQS